MRSSDQFFYYINYCKKKIGLNYIFTNYELRNVKIKMVDSTWRKIIIEHQTLDWSVFEGADYV